MHWAQPSGCALFLSPQSLLPKLTLSPPPHAKLMPFLRLPLCVLLSASALFAADSSTDPRLADALKRYPAADKNGDGVLTLEEAQAFAKQSRRSKSSPTSDSAATADDTGAARPSANKPAPTHADVRYGLHERNVLDLWLAKSDAPTPVVVFIHGGGFVSGSKAGASADMINGCLEAGVSFMAINYRFRTTAPIQEILRDCARSIQFVRSKAKTYNLDPKRIAAYGGSGGAGASLWLAFHDDLADPQNSDPVLRESSRLVAAGAINTQATYNLLRWAELFGKPLDAYERPGETASFYGATATDDLETPALRAALHDVDMLAHISPGDAPVFLYTSHPDGELGNRGHLLHHPAHARAVKKRCDEQGVPAIAFFAFAEPTLRGDYQPKLRAFLLEQLKK